MKALLLFISVLFFTVGAFAQQMPQSVELKDGSVVVGQILKKYEDGSVKIEAAYGVVIIAAKDIIKINASAEAKEPEGQAIEKVPLQYQPQIVNYQDVELRKNIEAYRKNMATGYALEGIGLGLLIGGAFAIGNKSSETLGTGLIVAGTACSIGGLITIWTSPNNLRLSTDGANLKLSF